MGLADELRHNLESCCSGKQLITLNNGRNIFHKSPCFHIQTQSNTFKQDKLNMFFFVSVLAKHAPDQDVFGSVWILFIDLGLVLMSLEGYSWSFVLTTLNVKFL